MVIKMCSDDIRHHIVCRMLHRSKRVDLLPDRKYDDTARMLPCRPAHTDTTLYNTVDLTVSLADLTLFIIFFHITKCGLVCQRTDRAGTEGLTGAENYLRIFMRLTLVIAGEVQVDGKE